MIEKIIIKVGKKKIELTLKEAKQLKADLDGIFTEPLNILPYYPPVNHDPEQFIYKDPYPIYPTVTWESTSAHD